MSLETNKQTVLAYVEAFNQAEWETLKALFTDDTLIYGVLGWGSLDLGDSYLEGASQGICTPTTDRVAHL